VSPRGGKRVGAGRPKTIKEPARVAFRVEADLLAKAQRLAKASGLSVSDVFRAALENLPEGRRKPRPADRKRAAKAEGEQRWR
jgi:uncharacterized protein YggE